MLPPSSPHPPIDARLVAVALDCVGKPGHERRSAPEEGDLRGDFDFWFDGGAGRYTTGVTVYTLTNGVIAYELVHANLSVSIRMPDGRKVIVREEDPPAPLETGDGDTVIDS